MKCPKCGRQMSMGAPHCEEYGIQWECHGCGKIIGIARQVFPIGHPENKIEKTARILENDN